MIVVVAVVEEDDMDPKRYCFVPSSLPTPPYVVAWSETSNAMRTMTFFFPPLKISLYHHRRCCSSSSSFFIIVVDEKEEDDTNATNTKTQSSTTRVVGYVFLVSCDG